MGNKKKTAETTVQTEYEPTFTKEQLISSMKFRHRRDALAVCLDDNKKYTLGEAEKALADFLKGKV